jgi:hypothetical protein
MKYANSDILDRPIEEARDHIARAEEYLQPRMRRAKNDLIGKMRARVREFPMTAMLTAFAGGLLIGAVAFSRRQSLRDLISLDLSEPIQRGGQMIGDTMEAAGQALRDRSDSMRSMARRDLNMLRKEAGRWQRKMHL